MILRERVSHVLYTARQAWTGAKAGEPENVFSRGGVFLPHGSAAQPREGNL